MILNLETKKVKKLTKTECEAYFDLPKVYFNNDQQVHVNEIAIKQQPWKWEQIVEIRKMAKG